MSSCILGSDGGNLILSLLLFFQLMCTVEDLKEMGIPLGPRKKIAKFVKERVNKQVSLSLSRHQPAG